jgi:putative flippase GtrA
MKPHAVAERITRYAIVGAICAIAQNGIMIAGGIAGGHYVPLSLLAFGIVTTMGYFLHARVTFHVKPSFHGFARFASGVATGFPLYFFVMAILCSGLQLAIGLAAPVATVVLYLWNYNSAHWALRCRLRLAEPHGARHVREAPRAKGMPREFP